MYHFSFLILLKCPKIITDSSSIADVSIKQNANGIFDLSCAERLVQLPEYNQAMLGVYRLKDADLAQLATEEERVCFFGNLTNLMILHCHLSHIETRLQVSHCYFIAF